MALSRAAPVGSAVTLLAGCAGPSTKIAMALGRNGLDGQRDECVGSDMSSHRSIGQLQQLGRAAEAYRTNDNDPAHLSASDLMRVATELRNPAVPLAVAGAGVRCGIVAGSL